jgi:hypothetical protein
MSGLRRLVVSDRWFFITCRLLARRRILSESEFSCVARAFSTSVARNKGSCSPPGCFCLTTGMPYSLQGSLNHAPTTPSGLSVDRVLLPADERTRI